MEFDISQCLLPASSLRSCLGLRMLVWALESIVPFNLGLSTTARRSIRHFKATTADYALLLLLASIEPADHDIRRRTVTSASHSFITRVVRYLACYRVHDVSATRHFSL